MSSNNEHLEPTTELVLAQALEACLQADRATPGSSSDVIARAPDSARAQLAELMHTVQALQSAASTVRPSDEFRAAARDRLMQHIAGAGSQPVVLTAVGNSARARANRKWFLRVTAGLAAAALTSVATLTASASALPGDPLYGVKQAQEELSVRLAFDDDARALALLRRADARLDEAQRLLEQGRAEEAAETADRYDTVVEQATSTFVTTTTDDERAAMFAAKLKEHQERLQAILGRAPAPAVLGLRQALLASEESHELAANPQAVQQALREEELARARALAEQQARAQAVAEAQATPTPMPTPAARVLPTRAVPPSVPTLVALVRDMRRHEDEARFADGDDQQAREELARVHPPEEGRPAIPPQRPGQAPDTDDQTTLPPARVRPEFTPGPRPEPPTGEIVPPERRGPPPGFIPPNARFTPTPTPTVGNRRGNGNGNGNGNGGG